MPREFFVRFIFLFFYTITSSPLFSQTSSITKILPVDTAVRIGVLPNGMTYYLRYNNWPEQRAEFFIVQRVGSLQEEEKQRGLAHFLEHMCFNGTEHFPGNELIRWCETIGVKFGRDLNAYTSIDRTVYNISNVPTTRKEVLDSCLLILKDWANGLLLDSTEIEKERGVIHEEWRLRSSAMQRMLERSLPLLYPNSKYGVRMPIGLMSVVDSCEKKDLADYYHTWYRPDNQAIIVVGNIDLNHTEDVIKNLFSGHITPENAPKVEPEAVPDNDEPIVVTDKDKELSAGFVSLMVKHEVAPDSIKGGLNYFIREYVRDIAMTMLSSRLEEQSKKTTCPFINATANYGSYLFATQKDAFTLECIPKEGRQEEALKAITIEALRASKHGFTPTEYARACANIEAILDKQYTNKDKRYSGSFCDDYKENFLSKEPIPSFEDYYTLMKWIIPNVPLEEINATMSSLITQSDTNTVIICFDVERQEAHYPSKSALLEALNSAKKEVKEGLIEPYVDNVKDEPLLSQEPYSGTIISRRHNDTLDIEELELSNGVKISLKPTNYKNDQILLSGIGLGGSSLYGEEDFANIKMYNEIIRAGGLGSFSHDELEKALAGKVVGVSLGMSTQRNSIGGSSTPNDIATMFELLYLTMTDLGEDQEAFNNLMEGTHISIKNGSTLPEKAFSDSLSVMINCHNPRFSPLKEEDLDLINYKRVLAMAQEQTRNASGYRFSLVGNFEIDSVIPLIEKYIASLPANKDVIKGQYVNTNAKGNVVNHFKRKMETPKANIAIVWSADSVEYNLENNIKADVAGQILTMIYLEKIREEAGAAYSVRATGSLSKLEDKTDCGLFVVCPAKPEQVDMALSIMHQEVEALALHCDSNLLVKVKEYMLKAFDDRIKTNSYWISIINELHENAIDMHSNYRKTVETLKPEDISNFVATILSENNCVEIVMLPENQP